FPRHDEPQRSRVVTGWEVAARRLAGRRRVRVHPRQAAEALCGRERHRAVRSGRARAAVPYDCRLVLYLVAALVIGHSVQGRPLRAYEVGNPKSAEKVLVVGCIHGNECAGTAVVTLLERTRPRFDLW